MVSVSELKTALDQRQPIEYQCQANLNLYDSPTLTTLATQAVAGRQLRVVSLAPENHAIQVCLCEDDYPGWLPLEDVDLLEQAETLYQPIVLSDSEIRDRLPQVLAYLYAAMEQPNHYLWGGTVGPNYDCSGLLQAAFTAAGIWLPRDAYQQAAFTQAIDLTELQPGDLIFFGSPRPDTNARRINHVGLYLGDGYYIHSSGKDQGRNGIGIDPLSEEGGAIAQAYYRQLHSAGRVVSSYQAQGLGTGD